jgi:hypothetical protein
MMRAMLHSSTEKRDEVGVRSGARQAAKPPAWLHSLSDWPRWHGDGGISGHSSAGRNGCQGSIGTLAVPGKQRKASGGVDLSLEDISGALIGNKGFIASIYIAKAIQPLLALL